MTKLPGWVAATAMAAALATASPAVAFHGGGFGGGRHFGGRGFGGTGGMRMGRRVSGGAFHGPALYRHHRHFRNVVFVGEPLFYGYVPYYYEYVPYYHDFVLYGGNYCWQQVWTVSGWQWFDVCPGYHGYGY